MNISFHSVGKESVTMVLAEDLAEGQVCMIGGNGSVVGPSEDDEFFGVIENIRNDLATVIFRGFVTVPYTGTAPQLGLTGLAGCSDGKVKSSNTAAKRHVVCVNSVDRNVTFLL